MSLSRKQKDRIAFLAFSRALRSGNVSRYDPLLTHNGVKVGEFHTKFRFWNEVPGIDCVTLEDWVK